MIDFIPTSYQNQNAWHGLWLLTPEEVKSLPDGTHLTSIMDNVSITGHDYIDLDTRFGYTAWGVYREDFDHALPFPGAT